MNAERSIFEWLQGLKNTVVCGHLCLVALLSTPPGRAAGADDPARPDSVQISASASSSFAPSPPSFASDRASKFVKPFSDLDSLPNPDGVDTKEILDEILRAAITEDPELRNALRPSGRMRFVRDEKFWVDVNGLYQSGIRLWYERRNEIAMELKKASNQEPTSKDIDEAFDAQVRKDLVVGVDSEGRFEINAVNSDDGSQRIYFIRVIHADSGVSICFSERQNNIRETRNFKKWVALQNLVSGSGDGKTGRDVLYVELQDGAISKVNSFVKPASSFTGKYWRLYKDAIVTHGRLVFDTKIAVACLGIEGTFMLAVDSCNVLRQRVNSGEVDGYVSEIMNWIQGDLSFFNIGEWVEKGEMNPWPYVPKVIFGLVVGSQAAQVNGWSKLGPRMNNTFKGKLISVLKQYSISAMYGFALLYTMSKGNVSPSAALWTAAGLTNWAFVLSNKLLTGAWRDEVAEAIQAAAEIGEISGKEKDKKIQYVRLLTGNVGFLDFYLKGAAQDLGEVWHAQAEWIPEWSPLLISRAVFIPLLWATMRYNQSVFKKKASDAAKLARENPSSANVEYAKQVQLQYERLTERASKFTSYMKSAPKRMFYSSRDFWKGFQSYLEDVREREAAIHKKLEAMLSNGELIKSEGLREVLQIERGAVRDALIALKYGGRNNGALKDNANKLAMLFDETGGLSRAEISSAIATAAEQGVSLNGADLLTRLEDLVDIVIDAFPQSDAGKVLLNPRFKATWERRIHILRSSLGIEDEAVLTDYEREILDTAVSKYLLGIDKFHDLKQRVAGFAHSLANSFGCGEAFSSRY